MKSCTLAIPRWFPKKWLLGFFILEKQLASQNLFLVKSELSLTTYLFLVFFSYIGIGIWRGWWRTENSTWTPWFSFPREKQRVFIFQRIFWWTLFYSTSLSWPLRTESQTEKHIHLLRVGWRNLPTLYVGWRNFFSSCAVVSVFGSGGK